ncbi:MAG: hypothetical protein IPH57_14125 [Saprospiraceae bacterium]|nr:hypothetical protein [Saprospiraceae bacterium]
MSIKVFFFFAVLIIFRISDLHSQEDSLKLENEIILPDEVISETSTENGSFEFSGYLKFLNSTSFADLNYMLNDNHLHNRLNFKAYFTDNLTLDLQIRNRLLWGASLSIPGYKDLIDPDSEINLSAFLIDKPGLLLHSKIDRLALNYNYKNWEFKLGRQRLNWGKTWAWNSNDLFNAYNFLDYDYEERPGSDAVSLLYNTGTGSFVQGAYSYGSTFQKSIIALRYQFNIRSYDIQLLAAHYFNDIASGIGWEGNIKNLGFKGESTIFIPEKSGTDKTAVLTSFSVDYFFKNGYGFMISALHNSNGVKDIDELTALFSEGESLNSRNLMPNKWSLMIQNSYEINPAASCSLSVLYLADIKAFAVLPVFTYSISNDWDFNFIGQLFFMENDNKISNLQNNLVLRFRYSF